MSRAGYRYSCAAVRCSSSRRLTLLSTSFTWQRRIPLHTHFCGESIRNDNSGQYLPCIFPPPPCHSPDHAATSVHPCIPFPSHRPPTSGSTITATAGGTSASPSTSTVPSTAARGPPTNDLADRRYCTRRCFRTAMRVTRVGAQISERATSGRK
ncbi:hypothetical protein OH76DRAFT_220177 [Lentinus brumalis]|uniref:Uncharacterized protein n=1 Tax=Lentinus brumalis TaxID=2498619 RepID=A0A371CM15_9APHY|nr:hypothetical protein OH76DRAFT_220177 [Polyporus brumalis]